MLTDSCFPNRPSVIRAWNGTGTAEGTNSQCNNSSKLEASLTSKLYVSFPCKVFHLSHSLTLPVAEWVVSRWHRMPLSFHVLILSECTGVRITLNSNDVQHCVINKENTTFQLLCLRIKDVPVCFSIFLNVESMMCVCACFYVSF